MSAPHLRPRPGGRHRLARLALLAALAPVALSACSGSDDGGRGPGGPSGSGPDAAPVRTTAVLGQVVGRLPGPRRAAALRGVREVVDGWIDGAFPATGAPDVRAAFADFTPGAARAARSDRAALTAARGDGGVTLAPARRRLGVDLLATDRRARTATARVRLELRGVDDAGSPTRVRRTVLARLFLTQGPKGWTVFGYDATQGAPAPQRPAQEKHRGQEKQPAQEKQGRQKGAGR